MTRFLANKNPREAVLHAERELYSGLIRLHVLHHACQEPIFGLSMIESLHAMATASARELYVRC